MKRQDIGDNVIEIKHNKVTESWLVVKETLDATKVTKMSNGGKVYNDISGSDFTK